jgi:SAM-dependent methyltransferase
VLTDKATSTRNTNDFYPTPSAVVEQVVKLCLPKLLPVQMQRVLDPGCGTSFIWGRAIADAYSHYDPAVTGIDLHDPALVEQDLTARLRYIQQDYLTYQAERPFDLIIGNPPFRLVSEFITHSLDLVARNGSVLMLTRLGILESRKRTNEGLFTQLRPTHVFVFVDRPKFTGGNSSDMTPYCMLGWDANRMVHGRQPPTHLYTLDWKEAKLYG